MVERPSRRAQLEHTDVLRRPIGERRLPGRRERERAMGALELLVAELQRERALEDVETVEERTIAVQRQALTPSATLPPSAIAPCNAPGSGSAPRSLSTIS
jgi:hypothetical protein